MNLMKSFNINYLLQNLKKSKVVLSIFIGLIPILNTIILIMMLTNNSNYILGFTEISIINLIGIYILPIIISICLFNYIYKKKSVDFINSMPISRKSIFITNTILGIIIFTIMLLVNIILIIVVTTIFNTTIPYMMLFDYFWFFLIVYIFAFSAANLAMTISGNAITQIIVTLLLFFLIPYSSAYMTILSNESTNYNTLLECTNESCKPEKYYCYDDLDCNINKELNRYETNLNPIVKNKYTAPFGLLYNSINYNNEIINTNSVIKMIILSIIYIILGYVLFIRRKMEVSETSFKSIHTHNLVKSLTLIPMVSISYIALRNQETIFIIFVVVIMLIYYFVYDLITRKSISHIKLSCIYFVITIVILTSIFSLIDQENTKNTVLKYNELKEISININEYSGKNNEAKVYTANKELIGLMTKEMLNEQDYSSNYITTYFKTKNNKEYKATISVTEEAYDKIISLLSEEKEYVNYYKNINMDEVYVIKLGNKIYSKEEAKPYLKLISDSLKELSLKEFLELQQKYRYVNDNFYIELYTYKYHNKQKLSINGYINYNLLNTIVNSNNSLLKDKLTPIIPDDYYLYYQNAYLNDAYNIDFYVVRSAKNELYDFILKNIKDEVDMRKEYFIFELQLNYNTYQFTTNKVDEIKAILDKKYNEIKDTPDYQTYNDPYTKESVEYYD